MLATKVLDFFERSRENLCSIVSLLSSESSCADGRNCVVPEVVDHFKAFKTVPYNLKAFNSLSEEDFFSTKLKNELPYFFEGRGLGKSRFSMEHGRNSFDYSDYGILFINQGLIRFIGIASSYDNEKRALFLDSVLKIVLFPYLTSKRMLGRILIIHNRSKNFSNTQKLSFLLN